jgi:hypothetical protein
MVAGLNGSLDGRLILPRLAVFILVDCSRARVEGGEIHLVSPFLRLSVLMPGCARGALRAS